MKFLSLEELLALYPNYNKENLLDTFDITKIPPELHDLIPYARFWGIGDAIIRDDIIENAPKVVLINLQEVFDKYEILIEEWLCGPEIDNDDPTNEYIAFSALQMAVDAIFL